MKTRLVLATVVLLGCGATSFAAEKEGGVNIQVSDDHIDFLAGSELVARYHKGAGVAKPYFWPVNAPGGIPLTRAWPMAEKAPDGSADHLHQKSAWFCHGDVIPEGLELKQKLRGVGGADFWSEMPGHSRIVCVEVSQPKLDKNLGLVTTRNEWRTADGVKLLDETRTISLHDYGTARLFVVDIDLHASVANLTFGDTKEGAFGIRVNDAIREEIEIRRGVKVKGPGKIENADGKIGEKACWGQLSAWCDYSGPIAGKVVGIAILDDPKSPYPACWHSRGYGLMAANPFGRSKSFPAMKDKTDLVKLAKGNHLTFRYGLLLHPGDAKEGKVAEHFARFAKQ